MCSDAERALIEAEATAAAEQRLGAGIAEMRKGTSRDEAYDLGWNDAVSAFELLLDTPTPASPRQGEPVEELDEAWRAVEDALPEGWRIDGLHNSSDGWFAVALAETPVQAYVDTDYHGTPAEALLALAAALSEPAEAGEPA